MFREFLNKSTNQQLEVISDALKTDETYSYINYRSYTLEQIYISTLKAVKEYYMFTESSPMTIEECPEIKICFQPETFKEKTIFKSLIYFAHLVTQPDATNKTKRFYSKTKDLSLLEWKIVIQVPQHIYEQIGRENRTKSFLFERVIEANKKKETCCIVMFAELIKPDLLRVHAILPDQSLDKIEKNKRDNSLNEITSFEELRCSISPSATEDFGNKGELFTKSDTNIQQNPELPNNSEEKFSGGEGIEISAKVEARLREKQAKKEFRDSENRIGGSRKELAAYRIISMSDLTALEEDEVTAFEMVKKEKVWSKYEIPTLQDAGVSAGAAYLKVKMREAFGSQPPNNKDKRKIYVGFVEYLVEKFANVITVKEFEEVTDEVMKKGLPTIIKILNPELYEIAKAKEDEMFAQSELIEAQIKVLEDEQTVLKDGLIKKYPALVEDGKYFTWSSTLIPDNDESREENQRISELVRQKKNELSSTKREVNSVVNGFLQDVLKTSTTYYAIRGATKNIFEEIFGTRFTNFITRYGTKTVQETYDEAKNYEPLSLEESETLTEQHTKYGKTHLEEKRKELLELQSCRTKEQYDDFFIEKKHGDTGWTGYQSNYKKYSYYKDINRTIDGIDWYVKLYTKHLENNIASYELSIAGAIDKYKPRENDWSWAIPKKNTTTGEKSELTINKGIPLAYIKRTGGYVITDADVGVESIKEKFGFKDVEFGQSIKDTEAREHIRHFLGAMSDMGEILDLNLIKLNKIGDLKITFASRGSGGASAHYEPSRKLINLTKSKGDGSVAHEYCHYIDNILPKIDNPAYTSADNASVTRKSGKKSGYSGSFYFVDSVKNTAVANAMRDIFNYIYNKETPNRNATQLTPGIKEPIIIKEIIPAYTGNKRYNLSYGVKGDNIDDYFQSFLNNYSKYRLYENLTKADKDVIGWIVNKFGYKSYEFSFQTNKSAYYAFSSKMSSDYWTRDWELLARAWECYIFDKLAKAGRVNNYLVSGGYFGDSHRVYPQGIEREDLFILYDKLVETIKREYDLAGFVKFTEERSDEYLDLVDKTEEEKVETGIIVEANTDEVIEKIGKTDEKIKGKLRELLTLLHEEKLERGGKIGRENTVTDLLIKECGCNKK